MLFDNLSSTAQRAVGTIFLLPVVLGFFYSPLIAEIVLVLLGILMGIELSNMLGNSQWRQIGFGLCLGFAAAPASVFLLVGIPSPLNIIALIALASAFSLRLDKPKITLFGGSLALCLVAGSALLDLVDGHKIVLLLAAAIAACDTTAYFVGRKFGGPKLAPTISPKKTISGALGGVIGSTFVVFMLGPWFDLSIFYSLWGGLLIAGLAQAGDLFESSVKRSLNVKDSGTVIPGHGGVLDRFDGYILTLPAAFLFWQFVIG